MIENNNFIEYKIISIDDTNNEYIFVLNKEMTINILNTRNEKLLSDILINEYVDNDSIFFVRILCYVVDKINNNFKNNKKITQNDLIALLYEIDQNYLLKISYITTNKKNFTTTYFRNIIGNFPVKTYKQLKNTNWHLMHNLMILTLYGYNNDLGYSCYYSRSNDEVYIKSEIIDMVTEIYQESYVRW